MVHCVFPCCDVITVFLTAVRDKHAQARDLKFYTQVGHIKMTSYA